MAEQRLKAQKLLQKSLDQVQSLNTENFVMVPPKKATAFVNPHFKPKVDLPVMNVLPLNVAGKPLVAGTAINRLPVAAVQPVGAGQILLPGATPVLLPQRPLQSKVILSPMMVSPPAMVGGAITSRFILQNNSTGVGSKTSDEVPSPTTATPVNTQEVTSPPPATLKQPKETTQTIESRTEISPSVTVDTTSRMSNKTHIPCTTFPNCSFGNRCMYKHPACKFGDRCTNMHCVFSHDNSTVSSLSLTLCKFHPNCMKAGCPFKHPIAKACRFGANCTNKDCLYTHDNTTTKTLSSSTSSLNVSDKIWIAPKPKSHISERRFAVEGDVVSNPVSIVVTSTPSTTTTTTANSTES